MSQTQDQILHQKRGPRDVWVPSSILGSLQVLLFVSSYHWFGREVAQNQEQHQEHCASSESRAARPRFDLGADA